MRHRRAPRAPAALAVAALLAGCTGGDWHARPLPPDFPDLAFSLQGESGGPLSHEALAGHGVLVMFGFASCPGVCPATLARLRAALDTLPEDVADHYRVLFVSVDPRRDDPADLARYTAHFGERFIGATGPEQRLREVANRYGMSFAYGEPRADGFYPVDHPAAVLVFDADRDARLLVPRDIAPAALAEDLERAAEGAA